MCIYVCESSIDKTESSEWEWYIISWWCYTYNVLLCWVAAVCCCLLWRLMQKSDSDFQFSGTGNLQKKLQWSHITSEDTLSLSYVAEATCIMWNLSGPTIETQIETQKIYFALICTILLLPFSSVCVLFLEKCVLFSPLCFVLAVFR